MNHKVALVTGAAKGMGEAIATAFHGAGAAVVAMDVDRESADALAQRLGDRAVAYAGDVQRTEDARGAVARAVQAFGGLDVLVNNAGVVRLGQLPELSEEDWDLVLGVNLKGMYQTSRFAIPRMRERGGGAIVNISSVQAYWSQAGSAAYSASKGGAAAFTRALALDHAGENIRVTGIAPGSVRTPMLTDAARAAAPDDPDSAIRDWGTKHPIGRVIEPTEIAQVALFLAGDGASAMTGTTVLVDGGLSAGSTGW